MNKGKRSLIMFTVALTTFMSTVPSFAAIEAYVTEKNGVKYEYKVKDLRASVMDGTDLMKRYTSEKPVAVKDSIKGYIDYQDIKNAIIDAINKFDVDKYTESDEAKKVTITDVKPVDPNSSETPGESDEFGVVGIE